MTDMQSQTETLPNNTPLTAPGFDAGNTMRYGGAAVRGDEPRREARVRMRITQSDCANLQIAGSYVLGRGTTEIVAYRSEADYIMRELVRDDAERELIAQAKRDHERQIRDEIVEWLQERVEGFADRNKAELARLVTENSSDPEIAGARSSVLATTPHSWSGAFSAANFGRGPRPIESAVIVEELGPPEQLNEVRIDAQAKAVGAEVARAMASAMSEQHASEIANLKAKIERLEQLITEKKGK